MAVRKLAQSWQYDFTISGFGRQRQGGFLTRAEAVLAEKRAREDLISGARKLLFRDGYAQYMAATRMKDRARDAYEHVWKRIEPKLGELYVEQVDTSALDAFKCSLPAHLGPKSINQHLILVRATLRFLWKRGRLRAVPYVPMESVPKKHVDWYTKQERDTLLEGLFRLEPQWYLFYYLTTRLGLRTGEVYAIGHRQIPPRAPAARRRSGGATRDEDPGSPARSAQERRGLRARSDGGRPGRRRLARERGLRRSRVSLLEDRRLPSLHRQPRAAAQARAAEARSPRAQPPQGGAAFGGEPSGDERRVREGGAGPARPSLRAEHAPVRAPRLGSSAPARRGATTCAGTARAAQRHVNLASTDTQNSVPREAHGNLASTEGKDASGART